jgi:hypothetical protein
MIAVSFVFTSSMRARYAGAVSGPSVGVTAWRVAKGATLEAGLLGRPACPRGLRHGFGVGTPQGAVPLNMV